jgi:hypothetical protein
MDGGDILKVLADWNYWGSYRDSSIERPEYLERLGRLAGTGEIVVVKGVRRAGKSTLLLQYARKLIDRGVDGKNILMVNFEDPRFKNPGLELLDKVYDTYLEELQPDLEHYVILDEVQEIRGWEKFARYLHEAKKARVFVTGSNSKLLSEEYSTLLSGRHVDMEVFPLSFREFLEFNKITVENNVDAVKSRLRIRKLFREYMQYGGFPKVALLAGEKRELLAGYFNDIVVKDVQRRFNVRESGGLEELAKYYLTNISTLQSFNKISKALGLSLDTVERFSRHLSTARMVFFTPKFSFKLKEQILNPKKAYCVDTGLSNAVGFRFSENTGRTAENIVFSSLLKRGCESYYWRDYSGREVDFAVKDGLRVGQLIQSCWSLAGDVKEREVKALSTAMGHFGLKRGLVLTDDFQGEEKINGGRITYMPLWLWLLGGEKAGR